MNKYWRIKLAPRHHRSRDCKFKATARRSGARPQRSRKAARARATTPRRLNCKLNETSYLAFFKDVTGFPWLSASRQTQSWQLKETRLILSTENIPVSPNIGMNSLIFRKESGMHFTKNRLSPPNACLRRASVELKDSSLSSTSYTVLPDGWIPYLQRESEVGGSRLQCASGMVTVMRKELSLDSSTDESYAGKVCFYSLCCPLCLQTYSQL